MCADNLPFMRELPDARCDLIYADPPFEVNWSGGPGQRSVPRQGEGQQTALDAFVADLGPRLAEMWRLLSDRGSLYVHLDWHRVHHVKVMLDGLFGPECFLNEIVWSYRSGSRPSRWFARKHDTILLYAKRPGKHTFNRMHGGEYRTLDLKRTADGRLYKSTRDGPIYFHPDGPVLSDVWDVPFLSTVSKERTGYPSQKPEALLERIIRASSDEDDLVADFYCGSGTTLVTAKRLGRRWLGCDVKAEAVAITNERLARVQTAD